MTSNLTPVMEGLHYTQDAIDVLEDIYKKDTEIISAIRDLRFVRSRIVDVVRRETR